MKSHKWLLAIVGLIASTIHALPSSEPGSYPHPNTPQDLDQSEDNVDAVNLVKRGLVSQDPAERHQASISRPRTDSTKPPFREPWIYTFDDSAADGTLVYVIDTGFNTTIPAYQSLFHEPAWIIPALTPKGWNKLKNDPVGHGTCVASLVAAHLYGIAKKTKLVIVRVDPRDGTDQVRHFLQALDMMILDIQTEIRLNPELKGKIFINLSMGIPRDSMRKDWSRKQKKRFRLAMHRLNEMTMIFASAGNVASKVAGKARDWPWLRRNRHRINSYPQLWWKHLPNMMIVGAATADGHRSSVSLSGTVDLWVIAENIWCASPHLHPGGKYEKTDWGTSVASPQAVGLAAYIAGLPKKPKGFPDPVEDFNGYVAAMKAQLQLDSWIWPESRSDDPKLIPVPLISNQLLDHEDLSGKTHCEGRVLDPCSCAVM